jgi:GT2 family glycosyltransferase
VESLRIAVGIATAGRPQLLQVALAELACQRRRPDLVVVCAPAPDDIGPVPDGMAPVTVIGPRGLTCQRNAILDRARECDVVVFFDDDFLPEESYLAAMERVFSEHPEVALATGRVIADGIIGPGLSLVEARWALSLGQSIGPYSDKLLPVDNGYGCNFAVRMAAVAQFGCRFDERLPLYGWLEDVDFSRQLASCGRIVRALDACGVHLGIKHGRQSGRRLGYSQIANPIYLSRKGTCPWRRSMRLMTRNIAANLLRSLKPEPYVDRVGRVAGNIRALKDLLAGRLAPERILEL